MSYAICGLIPCYNNAHTIAAVAETVRAELGDVIIVDDGSNAATKRVLAGLDSSGFEVVTRARNGGKGAAVKTGFEAAHERGFSHAFQVDADGQHDLTRIPEFTERSRKAPRTLLLGYPSFDDSAPLGRRLGRKITQFWTHVETLGPTIVDPMCGFRVYPLRSALATNTRGDHMEFDIEVAVKMVRLGVPVDNIEVDVRYIPEDEGGLSNFRMFADNVAISWAHTRLVFSLIPWLLTGSNRRQLE